ncbi:MAG TPA: NUDIX hydrolase [Actinomycetota bacterium]|nr:NUDIX hydrolase [Actinomycetota bacterium]
MDTPQIAVGAVVIRNGALLMVQRAQEPASGLWSVPGGRVEKGEYLNAAVAREVREETGLDVEVEELLGILEVVGDPHYVILDFVATTTGAQEPRAGDDVGAARWVPLDEVQTLECTPRFLETMRGWGVEV